MVNNITNVLDDMAEFLYRMDTAQQREIVLDTICDAILEITTIDNKEPINE